MGLTCLQCDVSVTVTLEFCAGDSCFESRTSHRLLWRKCFVVPVSPSRQGTIPAVGHTHFLPNSWLPSHSIGPWSESQNIKQCERAVAACSSQVQLGRECARVVRCWCVMLVRTARDSRSALKSAGIALRRSTDSTSACPAWHQSSADSALCLSRNPRGRGVHFKQLPLPNPLHATASLTRAKGCSCYVADCCVVNEVSRSWAVGRVMWLSYECMDCVTSQGD